MTSTNPWAKVSAGESRPFMAATYNAMLEAALKARANKPSHNAVLRDTVSATIVLVKNKTGADVDAFSVLGIDKPYILPSENEGEFTSRIAVEGVTPTSAEHSGGRVVVTLYPVRKDEIGKAVLVGAVPVKIKSPGDPEDVTAAEVGDGEVTHLIASMSGSIRVLWIQAVADVGPGPGAGPGVDRWAIVALGGGTDSTVVVKITGKADGGGKYSGRILRGTGTGNSTGDLAMPEGMEEADDVLIFNAGEDRSDRNRLGNGTYHLGQIVGPAESPLKFCVVIDVPVAPTIVYHGKIKDDYVLGDNFVKVWRCSDETGSDAVEVEFDLSDPRQAAMAAAGWESENLITVHLRHPVDAIGLSESLGLKAGRVIAFVADGIEIKDYEDYGIPGQPGNCIDYLINAGTPDEETVHECSQTVLTGAALPVEAIRVYGKALDDWSPNSNTIAVQLVDRFGADLGAGSDFDAYITSPEDNILDFAKISAGDILALLETAPGIFHVVNADLGTGGKVKVNQSDELAYLEDQVIDDGTWTDVSTATGPDQTPVLKIAHDNLGTEVDRIDGVGVAFAGGALTWTPTSAIRDAMYHIIGAEAHDDAAVSLTGDGVWTELAEVMPQQVQVKHIALGTAESSLDLYAGGADWYTGAPYFGGTLSWKASALHRDARLHLLDAEKVDGSEVTLAADETLITMDEGGAVTATITHLDANPALGTVETSDPVISLFLDNTTNELVVKFRTYYLDYAGHLVGNANEGEVRYTCEVVTVDVDTEYDIASNTLRKKTLGITVLNSANLSGWIDLLIGTTDCP